MARIVCSKTLPVSIRPQARRFPTNSQWSVEACCRITKNPLAPRDPEEEVGRAKVAVGDPEILRRDDLQDLVQQRPFLGMTVFAQDHVGGQHQPGVEDDQRMAGQGPGADRPQLLEPVLGPGEMVAVEDPDAITGQPVRPAAASSRR